MTKTREIYRCSICGNIVEVLHEGAVLSVRLSLFWIYRQRNVLSLICNLFIIILQKRHFLCHQKISERKLIRLALLFFFYYITFFSKKGRAVKLTSDVIRVIPAVIV